MAQSLPRLLRLAEVMQLTGYSRDSVYRLGRLGRFPRHVKISVHASRWREDEIRAWLEARCAERSEQPAAAEAA